MGNPFRNDYTVKRMTGGTYIKGQWTPGDREDLTISMSVQPVTGKELENMNVGRRNIGKIKCYTDEELQISKPDEDFTGDLVLFQNDLYEIIAKEPWQSGIINHYKYYAEFRRENS